MGNGLGDSNLDGWNDPVEAEATFPPKVVSVHPLNDYEIWATETRGWRKLMAAVHGGAALSGPAGESYAASRVNVGSVVEAAQAFQATQDLLIWLEQNIRTAVASMVGDDKAWKGPAASAFRDRMNYYADLLGKQAEHLAGGKVPESTATANSINSSPHMNSLPSQLYDAANYLSWAQQATDHLDRAWATIASQNGVGSGSGPVPISGTEYEVPMARQMAEVVHILAEQYKITTDRAATSGVTMPTPSINVPTPPSVPTPNITAMNVTTPPMPSTPAFTPPSIGGITPPSIGGITPPAATPPPNIAPPSFPGPGEIGGPTPGGGGAGGGLPGFDAPEINSPDGPGGGGVPGGIVPGGVPPGIKPPGSADLGGPRPGAGVGGGTGGSGFTPPGSPGFGSPGGAGPGAGGSPGLPEMPDANGLLGSSDDFAPGAVTGVDIPAAPGGAVPGGSGFQSPMMPGMPGAGAPGAGAGAGGAPGVPEAPDAKGLVEGDAADWQSPGFDGVQVPAAPSGASSGGAGLGAPMPPMPGAPGPAGGASNSGATESPDARGLVGGDADDWRSGVDAGVPDGSGGAPAGGDGFGGVNGPQLPAVPSLVSDAGDDSPVATAPAGTGMPMMPGAPGAPGAGTPGAGVSDAPDASGLIEPDVGDWGPSAPDSGAPYAPSGAEAGGAGLETPAWSAPAVGASGPVPDPGATPAMSPAPDVPEAAAGDPAAPAAVGGVVVAPVLIGQSPLPGPAAPGSPSVQPVQAAQPGQSVQAGQSGHPGAGSPDGSNRKTGVAAPVMDVETVVLPGALGLTGSGAVAGLAGRGTQANGLATPHADPGGPARAGSIRRRSERDGDREPGDGADSTDGLREDDAVWGGDGSAGHRPAADHVPLVRPDDDPDDRAGWDDLSDADWLTGAPADDGRKA